MYVEIVRINIATLANLLVNLRLNSKELAKDVDASRGMFDKLGTSISGIGKSLTGSVTKEITGFFHSAVDDAADFEKQVSALNAVTIDLKTGKPTADLQKMSDLALELSTHSVFSATNIALAFTELAKAGVSSTSILQGAGQAAVVLAHATGQVDKAGLEKSAEIVAIALNQFQLGGDSAMHVADILTLGANTSAASVASLGQSLSYAGTTANMAGISFEDTVAMLDAMADAGLKGSRTGTNLGQVFQNIAKPTEAATAIWSKWGTSLSDANGDFIGMAKLLPIIYSHIKDMGKLEQVQTLRDLFGIQGGRAMNALLLTQTEQAKKAGKTWADYTNNLKGSGAAVQQSKILLDNYQGSIRKFRNTLHVISIEIGLVLIPYLRKFIDLGTRILQLFFKLPPSMKKALIIFALMVALIGPLLIGIGFLIEYFAAFIVSAVLLGSILGTVAVGLYTAWGAIKNSLTGWDQLASKMTEAFRSGKTVKELLQTMPGPIRVLAEPLLNIADAIGDLFRKYNDAGFVAAMELLPDKISTIVSSLAELAIIVITATLSLIVMGGKSIIKGAESFWNWLKLAAGEQTGVPIFTGGKLQPGNTGRDMNPIEVLAHIALKLDIAIGNAAIKAKDDIRIWIEDHFFKGYWQTVTTKEPMKTRLKIEVADDTFATPYHNVETRQRVEGWFQDWAWKQGWLDTKYKLKLTPDGNILHTIKFVNWDKIRHDIIGAVESAPIKLGNLAIDGTLIAGEFLGNQIRAGGKWLKDEILLYWNQRVHLGNVMINAAVELAGDLLSIAGDAGLWIRNKILGPGQAFFGGLAGVAVNVGTVLLNAAVNFAGELGSLKDNFTSFIGTALDWVGDKTVHVGTLIIYAAAEVHKEGTDSKDDGGFVDSVVNAIESSASAAHNAGLWFAKEVFYGMGQAVGLAAGSLFTAVALLIEGIVSAITNPMQLPGLWVSFGKWLTRVVKGGVKNFASTIGDWASTFWTGIKDGFLESTPDDLITSITQPFTDAANIAGAFDDVGWAIATGLWGSAAKYLKKILPSRMVDWIFGGGGGLGGNYGFNATDAGKSAFDNKNAMNAGWPFDPNSSFVVDIDPVKVTVPIMPDYTIPEEYKNRRWLDLQAAIDDLHKGGGGGGGKLLDRFTTHVSVDVIPSYHQTGAVPNALASATTTTKVGVPDFSAFISAHMNAEHDAQAHINNINTAMAGLVMTAGARGSAAGLAFRSGISTGLSGAVLIAMISAMNINGALNLPDQYGGGYSIGYSLGEGLRDGIAFWTAIVAAQAASMVSLAILAARQAALAKSPSQKMIALGHDLVDGLLIPLVGRKSEVGAAMGSIFTFPNAPGGMGLAGAGGDVFYINVTVDGTGHNPESLGDTIANSISREIKLKKGR